MNKLLLKISYYILALVGLIAVSWIIWARFLRGRIIRDIPDPYLTEYRFWILLYICMIYLYIIKNYLRPKEPNVFISQISERFFTPLSIFDDFLKYNKYNKQYYYNLMFAISHYLDISSEKQIQRGFYALEIIPRFILVFFLILDTFYFQKLELFYKVVLIGLLPLSFRYFNYSLKNVSEHWISELENKYKFVRIFEKGYESLISRKRETKAKYHYESVSIKEYLEIKYANQLDNVSEPNFPYEYIGRPYAKDEEYKKYSLQRYKTTDKNLTTDDYNEMDRLFTELIPKLLELKLSFKVLNRIKEKNTVKWPKVIIFTLYFISWSFILSISYWFYPVELTMFKYFLRNLEIYLSIPNDIFSNDFEYSRNLSLITKESVKNVIKIIWNNILLQWKK